ncbi:hypothetical protein PLESTM_001435800 [Pleodorina starrii]|nr:hypothetical protein PLESTM_001435800 [Pleodorina starrii]
MRGIKTSVADEDYELGAEAEEGRPAGGEKPLSSRYRGVCWNRKNRRWQAAINSGGKYVYLGSFLSEYDAARAFDKAAVKLRGTRAKLNFQYSEYVDENGNLLEDPKMKSVMYKIEAIQGGAAAGGGGGGGGHYHGNGGGGGGAYRADASADEGDLLHGGGGADGLQLPLPLPPFPDGAQPLALPPPLPPHRQLSPLVHAGGGAGLGGAAQVKQQQHACSSGGSKGSEWPGPRSGAQQQQQQQQQSVLGLNLQQQQQPQQQRGHDPSPFPPFSETVTTGVAGVPLVGGGGGGGMARAPEGLAGSLAVGPPPPLPLPLPPSDVRMQQPSVRGRGGAPAHRPPSPLHHMYTGAGALPAGLCMPGGGGCYDVPSGSGAVLPPGRGPPGGYGGGAGGGGGPQQRAPVSAAAARAILQELAPCSLLSYVHNRFSNSTEDMVGVLYLDATSPTLYGSAVWTGKHMIRMGMYDTERDARQASIRCMQLYCVFYQEESRAELFNAMTTILRFGGNGAGEEPPQQQQQQQLHQQHLVDGGGGGGGVPPPPPLSLPQYGGARGASRGSGGGAAGLSYNGLQQQQQQQHQAPSLSLLLCGGYGQPGPHPGHADQQGTAAAMSLQPAAPAAGAGAGAAKQQPPAELDNIFQYMAMISRSSRSNNTAGSGGGAGDAGGGEADGRPDALQQQEGGGACMLGKRGAPQQQNGYELPAQQQQQQQRHGGGGVSWRGFVAAELDNSFSPPVSRSARAFQWLDLRTCLTRPPWPSTDAANVRRPTTPQA